MKHTITLAALFSALLVTSAYAEDAPAVAETNINLNLETEPEATDDAVTEAEQPLETIPVALPAVAPTKDPVPAQAAKDQTNLPPVKPVVKAEVKVPKVKAEPDSEQKQDTSIAPEAPKAEKVVATQEPSTAPLSETDRLVEEVFATSEGTLVVDGTPAQPMNVVEAVKARYAADRNVVVDSPEYRNTIKQRVMSRYAQ